LSDRARGLSRLRRCGRARSTSRGRALQQARRTGRTRGIQLLADPLQPTARGGNAPE